MKVLIPTDFSKYSEATISCAINELKKITDCEIILMHVIEIDPEMVDAFAGVSLDDAVKALTERAIKKLEDNVKLFKEAGMKVDYLQPVVGDPVNEIVKAAEAENVDLIFMGAKGNGMLRKVLLGSVSEGVVASSKLPVLITKFKIEGKTFKIDGGLFDKVLYAFDQSEKSKELLSFLKKLPIKEIVALHVVENEVDFEFIESVKKELPNANILLKMGKPGKTILKVAKETKATLVAISSGEGDVGSVADYVIRRSNRAVLVYK